LILKHTDFQFSFEILAQMMEFLALLCRDYMTGHLITRAMTTCEKSTGAFLENFVISDLVLLFFKIEF